MKVNLFDFELPELNIALRPLQKREEAKLLYINSQGKFSDFHVFDIVDFLQAGDAIIFNDTKVIPAALKAIRKRLDAVAKIQVNLHMRISDDSWQAFVRPLKRIKIGEQLIFLNGESKSDLIATILDKNESGEALLKFNKSSEELYNALVELGEMPLPPYIARRRTPDKNDNNDYQTIFAKNEGAVAAPTAGFHFTEKLLASIKEKGLEVYFVTLHVGAGTFLPVKVEDTINHKMHSEIGYLSEDTAQKLNKVKARGNRIIAVGTTSLRLLESAVDNNGILHSWSGATNIFITPGYKFKAIDCLITNFHLPKSTLFMLVSAFSGLETMQKAYKHAIKNNYRFYSYGDTCLLELREIDD